MTAENEKYVTTKEGGARAEVFYMRTFDGEPAWRFYPTWNVRNAEAFKAYASRYSYGVDGSGKDCEAELRAVLEGLAEKLLAENTESGAWIAEKCYLLRDMFRPVSVLTASVNRSEFSKKVQDRRYIAYGMYAALTVGYQVDFTSLIADVCNLRDGILAGGEQRVAAVLEFDRLILKARCMNDVGSIVAWIGQLSVSIVNSLRAVLLPEAEKEKLPAHVQAHCAQLEQLCLSSKLLYIRQVLGEEYKNLITQESKVRVKAYAKRVKKLVDALLQKVCEGRICRRRDDEALRKATIEDTIAAFVRVVNSVKGKEKKDVLFKRLDGVAADAYKSLERLIVKGTIDGKELKKIAAVYKKKGERPAGWNEDFLRQMVDEYEALALQNSAK